MQELHRFPPITGVDRASFARFTIENRLPSIIDGIITENDFDAVINRDLSKLKKHILHEKVNILPKHGNDITDWKDWLQPYSGLSWFELPFYFAEVYFYGLILDTTNFFDNKIDPYAKQKQEDVEANIKRFVSILLDIEDLVGRNFSKKEVLKELLMTSLWGNKSDLSQLDLKRDESAENLADHTIVDDSKSMIMDLSLPLERMDIILDNSGVELFTDLVLAEKCISIGISEKVVLHAKAFPTFVSDATKSDIDFLLNTLKSIDKPVVQEFAKSIGVFVENKKILVEDHSFWNAPLHFFEFPYDLQHSLSKSDLLVFKGDANYRRIFGDRIIPFETSHFRLASYLPSRSLAIRILKSEIMVGLSKDLVYSSSQKDKDWLVNGSWGIIQTIKK